MRPIACESVSITGIRVRNPVYSPNTNGMDITSCKNVFISDCDIEAGDDAICIKSENPYGAMLPTQNIVVTNCTLTTNSNGFKIGTATNGPIENITFSNSVIYNSNVPYNYRVIAGIAIEMVDGGSIDGISVSNISMKNVRTPIFIRLNHRNPGADTFLRNVMIRGVDASGSILTSSITGMPDAPVEAITLEDIRIRSEEAGEASWVTRAIPEIADQYPEARMFGRLPGFGLYVRHAKSVRLRNVELIAEKPDFRPAVFCEDVEDVVIAGLETANPAPQNPVIALQDARRVFVQGSRAPENAEVYLRVEGAGSKQISVTGNDLSEAKNAVQLDEGALRGAVAVHS
jgi:polygalacturonase